MHRVGDRPCSHQALGHLAGQTGSMTKVIVLDEAESGKGTVPSGQPMPQPAMTATDQTGGTT